MKKAVNLALLKPATQSSICHYSRGNTVEADAAIAINGDVESGMAFHTDREMSPWWEVDLMSICIIERIFIINREEEAHRFCNFTILHSIDHAHWDVAFMKCDPRHFRTIEIPLFEKAQCRYIRIRLDAREYLHLCEVEVYGHPSGCVADDDLPVTAEAAGHRITVFSVLFNEGAVFLRALIENFLHFTGPDEHFVINMSNDATIDTAALPLNERIHFLQGGKRSALGHTLLIGHLEASVWAARNIPHVDYFVPISSNSLFIRKFEVGLAEQRLYHGAGTDWYVGPNTITESEDGLSLQNHDWWWGRIASQPTFLRFVHNDIKTSTLVPMQIEGLLAPAEQWAALAKLAPDIDQMGQNLDEEMLFPVEEVLPATFFTAAHGQNFTSICQVLWHPFRTMITMEQIIQPSWHFPPYISIAKWFDRNIDTPATAAVATVRGRELIKIISESLNVDDLEDVSNLYEMLRQLADALDTLLTRRRGYRTNVRH